MAIGKKLRFTVFTRDGFVCQYCGRSAPDVILEAEHIVAVADGGKDELKNLVTACRDCNRGKGRESINHGEIIRGRNFLQEWAEQKQFEERCDKAIDQAEIAGMLLEESLPYWGDL